MGYDNAPEDEEDNAAWARLRAEVELLVASDPDYARLCAPWYLYGDWHLEL